MPRFKSKTAVAVYKSLWFGIVFKNSLFKYIYLSNICQSLLAYVTIAFSPEVEVK
jgi:hypothetical protein